MCRAAGMDALWRNDWQNVSQDQQQLYLNAKPKNIRTEKCLHSLKHLTSKLKFEAHLSEFVIFF